MRILQVIHDFLPHHAAGSELYCYYLSKQLSKRHSVSVMFTEVDHTRPQYDYRRSSYRGLPLYEVTHNHIYRRFEDTYADPKMDRVFSRILDEVRPDVVHLQHLLNHSINYLSIARKRGIRVVFTLHDYWLSCPNGGQRIRPDLHVCDPIVLEDCADCIRKFGGAASLGTRVASKLLGLRARATATQEPPDATAPRLAPAKSLYRAMEGFLAAHPQSRRVAQVEQRSKRVLEACRDVDLFISPSAFLRDTLVEFSLPAHRVLVSQNGLHTDPVQPFRRRPSAHLRFGYVGTLAPHKGVHVLLEAFQGLLARGHHPAPQLRIHGNLSWFPDYIRQLRSQVEGNTVRFLGEFDNQDALEIYAGIDVLVVPSVWWENSPITMHEAMLTGTPVIASNFGGMADLVREGENGLLFQVDDAADLQRKMEYLLQNPARLEELRGPGVPVKTIEQDAADMEERYLELLHAPAVAQASTSGA